MIIPNKAYLSYKAIMPDGGIYLGSTESNVIKTEILSYLIMKTIRCDKTSVKEGENTLITATITNKSSTKLISSLFSIPQLDGTRFVVGSVKINGVVQPTYDPVNGFNLSDINSGETVVVEYQLKVNRLKENPFITHFATFKYTVNDYKRNNLTFIDNTDSLAFNVISEQLVLPMISKNGKTHYTIKEAYNSCKCCYYCYCCNCYNCCNCCCYLIFKNCTYNQ